MRLLVPPESAHTPRRNARRPQPRGDESRARILEAFEEQLQTRSLAEISVADVAQAAGLKRPAFYFYFAGKHEVVTELLTRIFHDDVFTIEGSLAGGGDPRAIVADAMARTFESWLTHRTLFRAMLDARDTDPEAKAVWDSWLQRYEDFSCAYITAQPTIGIPDARALAHALISMNERVLDRYVRSEEGLEAVGPLRAAVIHVWHTALFGEVAQ
ncbi:TetR/AcrR family transcriptional regulator [Mycolicibacterium vaccae]|uniref:Tetr family transcriptional regulator n=1 Tax=Mycolicibacterium vaccae ATCC 25954 TaxID=1194972 RepID=K0UCT3_MYCVA|nr:TetR/AcrR family transcriptional regulator [Mycolicibacterium vaccae]ANI40957.1 TetR family transcriptional regulator [Mycolicibacterium vaccae 95051]EJZ05072.1 tetr family transcriptional regulator [Mycolicibacterium vaccae ATCC 25954]